MSVRCGNKIHAGTKVNHSDVAAVRNCYASVQTADALPRLRSSSVAPAFIAPDTYAGKFSVLRNPATVKAATFTAAELAAFASTGVIWESFGHTYPGKEGFGRSRYVATASGDLHIYNSEGAKVIIHKANRMVRVLTA